MVADGRGVGVKNREKFADVLNGWSLKIFFSLSITFTLSAQGSISYILQIRFTWTDLCYLHYGKITGCLSLNLKFSLFSPFQGQNHAFRASPFDR